MIADSPQGRDWEASPERAALIAEGYASCIPSLTDAVAAPRHARLRWRQDVPLQVQALALRASLALQSALATPLPDASPERARLALALDFCAGVAPHAQEIAPE